MSSLNGQIKWIHAAVIFLIGSSPLLVASAHAIPVSAPTPVVSSLPVPQAYTSPVPSPTPEAMKVLSFDPRNYGASQNNIAVLQKMRSGTVKYPLLTTYRSLRACQAGGNGINCSGKSTFPFKVEDRSLSVDASGRKYGEPTGAIVNIRVHPAGSAEALALGVKATSETAPMQGKAARILIITDPSRDGSFTGVPYELNYPGTNPGSAANPVQSIGVVNKRSTNQLEYLFLGDSAGNVFRCYNRTGATGTAVQFSSTPTGPIDHSCGKYTDFMAVKTAVLITDGYTISQIGVDSGTQEKGVLSITPIVGEDGGVSFVGLNCDNSNCGIFGKSSSPGIGAGENFYYGLPNGRLVSDYAVADITGDGGLDVLFVQHSPDSRVLLARSAGPGVGNFSATPERMLNIVEGVASIDGTEQRIINGISTYFGPGMSTKIGLLTTYNDDFPQASATPDMRPMFMLLSLQYSGGAYSFVNNRGLAFEASSASDILQTIPGDMIGNSSPYPDIISLNSVSGLKPRWNLRVFTGESIFTP